MDAIARTYQILQEYDRMPSNPDTPRLKEAIEEQLWESGLLRLLVFVCPKFNTEALLGPKPEEYMPTLAKEDDLFRPRVPKILEIKYQIEHLGIPVEPNLIIGENDAEIYIFPFLPRLKVNPVEYARRQELYKESFNRRAKRLLGKSCVTWSLADLQISPDDTKPTMSEKEMERELVFFIWLFSEKGPYYNTITFSKEILRKMVMLKFRLYGSQGKFLQELGGILLQTEGPGVWLQRTQMLRCTGAEVVPTIYPWIREEELISWEKK